MPANDLPFLWPLAGEVTTAANEIVGDPHFEYLHPLFGERRSPLATRLSYSLMNMEDALLVELCARLGTVSGVTVIT